jgi:hypothetical protein
MLLSRSDKKQLLDRFPTLELSYENILHKKVCADLYVLIPNGQKALIWFTYWKDKNACFILMLNEKNNIDDIKVYPVCFSSKLSLNTVIYGTLFKINNLNHFSCEKLFYYKNNNVTKYTILEKLNLLKEMFEYEIKQVAYTSDFLILGLPIMKTNYEQMLTCINGLSYSVYGIQSYKIQQEQQHQQQHQNHHMQNELIGTFKINKHFLPEATFRVKATIEMDIYHLYVSDTNTDTLYGVAMIPSYKSSVMMNSLFRNIKENINLDLLEESDDEEYENINSDKFVNLNKTYTMKCVYNRKFKKWQPTEIVDDKQRVISSKEAQLLEK